MGKRALAIFAVLGVALTMASGTALGAERTVSVSATAKQEVANDSARLGFAVSKERHSRAAALRAVSIRLRAVIAAVQSVPGVGEGDITTGRVSVRDVSRGEKRLFRASEGIAVLLHRPDVAGELIGLAIEAGATGVSGPTFLVGDREAAFRGALGTAFAEAKAKAAILASAAGATLGPVVTIVEGGSIVPEQDDSFAAPVKRCASATAPRLRKACTAPSPPTKPGTSTVEATVQVVFELL